MLVGVAGFEPATPWSRTRCATKASFRDRPVRRRGLRFWSRRTKRSTRFSWPDRVSSRTGESLCHRATTAHGVVRDLHLHRRFGHSRKREIRAEYVNQGDHFARSLDCAGMNGPKTSGEARASEEEAVVTAAPAVCQPLARPLGSIDIRDPAIYEQDAWLPLFARPRRNALVPYCAESRYGRYWSATRYNDVMTVELDYASTPLSVLLRRNIASAVFSP